MCVCVVSTYFEPVYFNLAHQFYVIGIVGVVSMYAPHIHSLVNLITFTLSTKKFLWNGNKGVNRGGRTIGTGVSVENIYEKHVRSCGQVAFFRV